MHANPRCLRAGPETRHATLAACSRRALVSRTYRPVLAPPPSATATHWSRRSAGWARLCGLGAGRRAEETCVAWPYFPSVVRCQHSLRIWHAPRRYVQIQYGCTVCSHPAWQYCSLFVHSMSLSGELSARVSTALASSLLSLALKSRI
jgi:hypothetical protein